MLLLRHFYIISHCPAFRSPVFLLFEFSKTLTNIYVYNILLLPLDTSALHEIVQLFLFHPDLYRRQSILHHFYE